MAETLQDLFHKALQADAGANDLGLVTMAKVANSNTKRPIELLSTVGDGVASQFNSRRLLGPSTSSRRDLREWRERWRSS